MEDSGIESDAKYLHPLEDVLFQGSASDSSCSSINGREAPKSSVKQLHRKLEQRIEQAKKLQKYQQQDLKKQQTGPTLIPIQRLSIPSKNIPAMNKENVPLVDWDTDDSEEDIHFFPIAKQKENYKQNLKDTFSVEDFEMSPDEDDLNLLPPKPVNQRFLCCFPIENKCCIL